MQHSRVARIRLVAMSLPLALCLAANGCEDYYRVVVRISSTIHPQGGITRYVTVDVTPTRPSNEQPDSPGSTTGIDVAHPEAWDYVEKSPGRLRAEGFFASVDSLPPTLSYDVNGTATPDRDRSALLVDDRTVMRRWIFSETYGDLFSPDQVQAAIDVYIRVIDELLRSELPRHIGDAVDWSHVETFLKGDLRDFFTALVEAARQERSRYQADRSDIPTSRVFVRYGLPEPIVEEDEEFWDKAIPLVEDWFLSRLADALARSGLRLAPEQIRFWPPLVEEETSQPDPTPSEVWWMDTAERVWGGEDAIAARLGPASRAIAGFFEAEGSRAFRFEFRVRLPGTVLTTNGTLDGDEVIWILRDSDLTQDRMMSVESIELLEDGLRALGARRSFDVRQLVQLHDLLFKRDPGGELGTFLADVAAAGDLGLLRDRERIPLGLRERSLEVADLLDPDVAPPAP